MLEDTGIVVIARNEGERLKRCLASCSGIARALVYSDSDSSDGSADYARSQGIEVVVLDTSQRPPNQPRGRNAGLEHLREVFPDVEFVFFMDGDCELVPGFLEAARAELRADAGLGAVCGRRVEIAPEASVYNMLIDTEWNTAVGAARDFGGDTLVRVAAVLEAGGYNESMISGEDLELSFRMHEKGWKIRRIAHDMTRHDVAIHRFSSWWKRHARGGYAYAHGAALNFHGPECYNIEKCRSTLFWGLFLPVLTVGLAWPTQGWSLLLLLLYVVLGARVWRWRTALGDPARNARVYAFFIVVGKFAEAWGVLQCAFGLLFRRGSRYVEYKDYQRKPS